MNLFDLTGMVALVTGGGSGIGRATALKLGALGATVVITELADCERFASEVVLELKHNGINSMHIVLDVRNCLTIDNVIYQIANKYGRLDILINNAGTQILKTALEINEDEFDEIINVNLKGPYFVAQSVAAIMIKQKSGSIVNVASQHGVVGNRLRAPYCASKGGLINLTRALALEWAEYGIRVNSVSPTYVLTDRNKSLFESREIADEILKIPMGRPATPDEVASAICFLSSTTSGMITGHNLVVDGGWTAQ